MKMHLVLSGNHSFCLEMKLLSNTLFIPDLIHYIIHDVRSACTPSPDDRPHHDFKCVLDNFCDTVRFIFFVFFLRQTNEDLFIITSMCDSSGKCVNLKNLKVSLEGHCEYLKYVQCAVYLVVCSILTTILQNGALMFW